MALPRHLKFGVVLFPQNFPLDWVGPTDILNTLRPSRTALPDLDLSISLTLLAESLDPVQTSGGWSVVPQKTFDQAREEEWDGILVPGGSGARPWAEGNQAAQEFIKLIGPTCKVVLTGEELMRGWADACSLYRVVLGRSYGTFERSKGNDKQIGLYTSKGELWVQSV